MPFTPELSRKLHQTLGAEAAADLMQWMQDVDAQRRESREALRADLAEMRQEVRAGFAHLETRFERRFGDLIKWSFVFWCGAVGAVALLARALG